MRHRKRGRKLSRTPAHRKATRQNIAKALIEHERIITTPAKAKETKSFVEKLITLARKAQPYKDADNEHDRAKYVHYYRQALKKLQDKKMVQKLFGEGPWRDSGSLGQRYLDRPSGQTRIIRVAGSRLGNPIGYAIEDITEINYQLAGKERKLKLSGNRLGDNAQQVIFELIREGEGAEEEEDLAPSVDIDESDDSLSVSDEKQDAGSDEMSENGDLEQTQTAELDAEPTSDENNSEPAKDESEDEDVEQDDTEGGDTDEDEKD